MERLLIQNTSSPGEPQRETEFPRPPEERVVFIGALSRRKREAKLLS
jgi:hypothetical protein